MQHGSKAVPSTQDLDRFKRMITALIVVGEHFHIWMWYIILVMSCCQVIFLINEIHFKNGLHLDCLQVKPATS